ncbi:MAG: ABC transporter permease [Candidatus Bathyarchaeia archaeon]
MSETFFPVNDLMRRKLQTSLTIASLTLCVASTLFLLLFSDKIGFGISLVVKEKLTAGFSAVFSRFLLFIGFLFFLSGAIFASFMAFVMMSQRVKDIGLMKAAGCPNDLIFGYFFNELLIVTLISCFMGVVLGLLADFASANILNNLGFQILQKPVNFWLILLVFVSFFVLAIVFGAKPILDATKVEPAKAFSPTYYWGVKAESPFKVVSKRGLTAKIALRSIFRHKSATIRTLLCLTAVFLLVTVAVAGGTIANQTTKNWVEKAVGRDILLIAHREMCSQYELLLSKFYKNKNNAVFNYAEGKYLISEEVVNRLNLMPYNISLEKRLITWAHIEEVQGTMIDENGVYISVGESRKGESLIIGVEPEETFGEWFLDGEFLNEGQSMKAVVGDSIANKMFTIPLKQGLRFYGRVFDVVGVCIDPINNGDVIYVALKDLQNVMGVLKPNILMVKVSSSISYADILDEIRTAIKSLNSEFEILELNTILDKNLAFLSYMWSTIMFLPLFSLASASLCFMGYIALVLTEQRQEFGVLRALGAEPRTIIKIVAAESLVVLLSSYACGVAFGIIVTLLILVPNPAVTNLTILQIAGLLITALIATFTISLCPAVKFACKSILEVMT